jgi:hypothetical protein
MRFIAMSLAGVVALGGCLLLDPLNDVSLGSAGGAGGTGGGGGIGGGATGGGGGTPCDNVVPQPCDALTVPTGVTGIIEVTDMAFLDGPMAVDRRTITVGTVTDTVNIGSAQLGGQGTRGFVLVQDTTGAVIATTELGEATAGSKLFVDVSGNDNSIVVGGNFESGSACSPPVTAPGLFLTRLVLEPPNLSVFDANYPGCIAASGVLEPKSIAIDGTDSASLAGGLNGTLSDAQGVHASTGGQSGFIFGVPPAGPPSAFVLGGSGDSIIRGIETNHLSSGPEWVLLGDFSGQLTITIPTTGSPLEETQVASGNRDLFIASIDRFDGNANLAFLKLGSDGGHHEAVGLSIHNTGPAYTLAANIIGDLVVPEPITIAGSSPRSGVVMTFEPPRDDDAGLFDYLAHHLITSGGDGVELTDVSVGNGHAILGGYAADDLIVSDGVRPVAEFATEGCQRDLFLMSLLPASADVQRCGDGMQTLHAVTRYGPEATDITAAMSVGRDGEALIGNAGGPSGPGTYLVFLIP